MALNDIRYDSFEEFIQAMADNLWDYTDKADASYIIDIVYDYRTQVTKKFPDAEFDVSMDVFENVMMALQRVINNLYNPALVNIIENTDIMIGGFRDIQRILDATISKYVIHLIEYDLKK